MVEDYQNSSNVIGRWWNGKASPINGRKIEESWKKETYG